MEISMTRTTVPGFQKMAGFSFPTEPRHCVDHGDYLAMNTPAGWSDCPRCNALRQQVELLRQEALAYDQSQMRRAAIPERFFDRRIATYQPVNPKARAAQAVVQEYADDFAAVRKAGRSLILCGGVGTGKTHLAVGAVHQVVAAGYTALYAVLLDAFRSIKDTYRKDSQLSEATVLARFSTPDLLVLDEIGVQNGTDTERMLMFSILNERYNQLKPTILISNLAKGPLEAHLGERAFDRMREGGGRMVVFDWTSFRGAQA